MTKNILLTSKNISYDVIGKENDYFTDVIGKETILVVAECHLCECRYAECRGAMVCHRCQLMKVGGLMIEVDRATIPKNFLTIIWVHDTQHNDIQH